MLRENAVFKKMIATGEERMSKIAAQLLSNERFMGALQKTVTAAMEAKGSMERAAQTAGNDEPGDPAEAARKAGMFHKDLLAAIACAQEIGVEVPLAVLVERMTDDIWDFAEPAPRT